MSSIDIKKLVEAGVHFGHRTSRWSPKMEKYIFGKHHSIHIVDLRETVRGLVRAQHFLARVTEAGHEVVFVGTKPQAREVVREQAGRCNQHFVVNRWLGGTLTNFDTIRSRLKRLEQLEAMETDESINLRSKKEISQLRRERRKIHRNLEGLRRMNKIPGAMIIVDTKRDHIALAEARLLGIPVISICDTDTDPTKIDLVIPGNDDAYRSIEVLLSLITDSIMVGREKMVARQAAEEKKRLEDAAIKRKAEEAKKSQAKKEQGQAKNKASAAKKHEPKLGAKPAPTPKPAAPTPASAPQATAGVKPAAKPDPKPSAAAKSESKPAAAKPESKPVPKAEDAAGAAAAGQS